MIFQLYIIRNIVVGTLLALLVLVSINVFFTFIRQLDDIGIGRYDFILALQYVAMKIPNQIVMSIPMSMLMGSILSLGSLASNNEIVVAQSVGVSVTKLILMTVSAALIFVVISLGLQQWIVPDAESGSYQLRASAKKGAESLIDKSGTWLKDGNQIIHLKEIGINGDAKNIKIYEFDNEKNLLSISHADSAVVSKQGWALTNISTIKFLENKVAAETQTALNYKGDLTRQLLKSIRQAPVQMSISDLALYQSFLQSNGLEFYAEKSLLWQKIYSPLAIIIMCVLAVPFILGSQRGGQAGKRLMMAILLGLSFNVIEKVIVGIGQQLKLAPEINTLIPFILFLSLTIWLTKRAIRQ